MGCIVEFIKTIIINGVLLTICTFYVRFFLEKKAKEAEEKSKIQRERAFKRYMIDDEMAEAQNAVHTCVVKGLQKWDKDHVYFNGDLQENFHWLKEVAEAKKNLEREELAKINNKG